MQKNKDKVLSKISSLSDSQRFLLIFISCVLFYLLLKSLFFPMKKPIKAVITQNKETLYSLDQAKTILKIRKLKFDKVEFRHGDELFHDNTGYLDFKRNFFMDIETTMELTKPEKISFLLRTDDGFRLIIDGKQICQHVTGRSEGKNTCVANLSSGKHQIEIFYFQGWGHLVLEARYQLQTKKAFYLGQNSPGVNFY